MTLIVGQIQSQRTALFLLQSWNQTVANFRVVAMFTVREVPSVRTISIRASVENA